MKPHAIFAAMLSLAAVSSPFAQCTGGQVITSFGPNNSNGFVQVSPPLSTAAGVGYPEGLVRAASGELYTVNQLGYDADGNGMNSLVGLKPGGALNPSFGGMGIVIPQGQPDSPASNVALDSAGNVIVASFGGTVVVNRYSPTGVLDTTFGSSGVASIPVQWGFGPTNVVSGSDGSVYVALSGINPATGVAQPAVIKLTPSGLLDTTFGTNGVSFFYPAPIIGNNNKATDIIALSSGSLLVGGRLTLGPGHAVFFVARLLPSGALDTTFGPANSAVPGISTYDFGFGYGRRLALLPSGGILEVGPLMNPTTGNAVGTGIIQLLPNGGLDPSFGNGGAVTASPPNGGWAADVAIQNNGKILLSGLAFTDASSTNSTAVVIRLTQSGSIDPTFGVNGIATLLPPFGQYAGAGAIVYDPGGTITVALGGENEASTFSTGYVTRIDSGSGKQCH